MTNKIYVPNSFSNTVTVIDGTDDSTTTITTGIGTTPNAVAINPVTNKIFTRHVAIVGLVSGQRATDIDGSGEDLTLTTFVAGPRYSLALTKRFVPFAHVLLGGAHASGSLAPGNVVIDGSSNAFAMLAGGGLDIGLNRHFAIRALEADYFMTRFKNGVNDSRTIFGSARGLWFEPMPGSHTFFISCLGRIFRFDVRILYVAQLLVNH